MANYKVTIHTPTEDFDVVYDEADLRRFDQFLNRLDKWMAGVELDLFKCVDASGNTRKVAPAAFSSGLWSVEFKREKV